MCTARAGENWIDVSATSIHFSDQKFNQNNFGLGLEHGWGDSFVMAGRYKNSLGLPSRYALAGYAPWRFLGADVGVVAGALDGYPDMRGGHPFFAAGGIAKWARNNYKLQIMLMPPIRGSVHFDPDGGKHERKATPAALGFMFGRKF